jgi:RNA polymerase sigma-70 factor (ECF subfamily)
VPGAQPPEPTRLGEVSWLEPFPDGPEGRYDRTESISLAFVTALQLLPPRQLAVLILRDVLDFPAAEVAGMLDTSTDSVKSALKRARTTLQQRRPTPEPAPPPGSPAEDAVVTSFVRAWEDADLTALVDLLTDDVFMSMPPIPYEYEGRDLVLRFCASLFDAGRRFHLVPTRANGQPAFGAYLRTPSGPGTGLYVLTLSGTRISALTRFDRTVLPAFNLPRTISRQTEPGR